jgi:hypothetical protein
VVSHLSASSFPHRGPRVRASSPHGTTRHGSGATRPCLRLKGRRPDWTVRTPSTARRLARPPLQCGFEAVRAATTVRSLAVRASSRQPPFEHHAAVSLSERRVTAAPSAPTAPVFLHAAGEVPRYLLLHAAFLHAAAPTSFRRPHPFCSPCRTPLAAALLRCLHPKLGSAAFLAPVRSPSCSLLVPLTRATMRATLLSSPHNVAPPCPCRHLGSVFGPPRTLGREPAARTGRARQDRERHALRKLGHVGTVAVGCMLLCHRAAAESARWPLNYFSIF